jgi:uncharacterized protein YjbJ (UPF0337 family)
VEPLLLLVEWRPDVAANAGRRLLPRAGERAHGESHVMLHKDEVTGKAQQVKGKAKQKVGEWTDDPAMVDEGVADEAEGDVNETVGAAKRKVAEVAEGVAKKVRKA